MKRYLMAPVVLPRIYVWVLSAAVFLGAFSSIVHWVALWDVGVR